MVLALIALAGLVALNVALGPLGLRLIDWRLSDIGLNQTYGADGAALVLIVPTAFTSAYLWWQQRRLAAPLALGTGLAALYYAIASALGPDYTRYGGNNERFFLILLGQIVLSWIIAARAWSCLDERPPQPSAMLARALGTVLLIAGITVGSAWLRQLLEIAFTGGLSGPDALAYADAPGAFWLVRVVDLGFIVPLCIGTGLGLWRCSPLAFKSAYALTCFLTLQSVSVLAMGIVMLLRQDPTATPGLVAVLAPVSLGLAFLTAKLLATYASSRNSELPM
jgi:hypothetical protein